MFWAEFLIALCPIPLTFFLVAANISHPFRPSPSWLVCWLFVCFQSSHSETRIRPTSRHKCWHVERSVSQRSGIRRSHLCSGVVSFGTAFLRVCLASPADCRNSRAQTRAGFKLNATDHLHDTHSDSRIPRQRNFTIASLTGSQITGQDRSVGTITVTRKIRAIRNRIYMRRGISGATGSRIGSIQISTTEGKRVGSSPKLIRGEHHGK